MNLGALVSETRHPDSMALDTLSTLKMVTLFNQQDRLVPEAIAAELPAVAAAIYRAPAAPAHCLRR
ncbi:N-acetylmuramic acid 6-phosphate etherase [Sodalis glossinidius str. 'morsitans']|uniref:N-acetylmuramic acid 6-phosphate etherase n=1 Tax=Sodalis glossinidius (strain morsitans) TaxID=343509 RepID=A0A193QLB2_SODGM|nr:N-acetylmuramic acid 6-phosphate etherase [Sodalis glossinidius str. 'morsitans']